MSAPPLPLPAAARGLYFDMWEMQRAAEALERQLGLHPAAAGAAAVAGVPGEGLQSAHAALQAADSSDDSSSSSSSSMIAGIDDLP